MFVVPSLSLLCWVFSTAPLSLFLFLSGAGETQTLLGFGIPLVSLRLGHDLPLGSVHRAPQLHLGYAPAPVFFPSSSFAGLVVVGLGLFGLCLFGGCWGCGLFLSIA